MKYIRRAEWSRDDDEDLTIEPPLGIFVVVVAVSLVGMAFVGIVAWAVIRLVLHLVN